MVIVPTHAMAQQLPLSEDVLWTRQNRSLLCFPVRMAETLAIGNN